MYSIQTYKPLSNMTVNKTSGQIINLLDATDPEQFQLIQQIVDLERRKENYTGEHFDLLAHALSLTAE